MAQFKDAYLSEDNDHISANGMWVKLKTDFVGGSGCGGGGGSGIYYSLKK